MSAIVGAITCGATSKVAYVTITNPADADAGVATGDNFQTHLGPLASTGYEHRVSLGRTAPGPSTLVRITWEGGTEETHYQIDWGSVDCGPVAPPTTVACPEGTHPGAPIGGPPQCVSNAVPIYVEPGTEAPPTTAPAVEEPAPQIDTPVTVAPAPVTGVAVLPKQAPVQRLPETGGGPGGLLVVAAVLVALGGALVRGARWAR